MPAKRLLKRWKMNQLSDRELGNIINLKIAEVKQNCDKVLKEHDAQREVIKENYDEQIGSKIDPVIKEGQRLESEIQTRMGKNIRKAIIFKALDKEVTIVDVGEEVTSGHLSEVQSIVKEMIVELESDLQMQRDREIEHLNLQKDTIRAEADIQMEQLRNELEDKTEETQTESARLRDELYELEPFTFLSESRYRENQAGGRFSVRIWGQKPFWISSNELTLIPWLRSFGKRFGQPAANKNAKKQHAV